jgi:hypothetical protein
MKIYLKSVIICAFALLSNVVADTGASIHVKDIYYTGDDYTAVTETMGNPHKISFLGSDGKFYIYSSIDDVKCKSI